MHGPAARPNSGAPSLEIIELAQIDSTSLEARRRLMAGWRPGPGGAVLCASEQTGGIGRLGRRWSSPCGGVYCSFVAPAPPPDTLATLSLAVGLASLHAVADAAPAIADRLRLKWPNDLLASGKKLGGVLIERLRPPRTHPAAAEHIIVGVGINANADPAATDAALRPLATSITAELGAAIDPQLVRAALFSRVAPLLTASASQPLATIAALLHPPVGHPTTLRLPDGSSIHGTTTGLGPAGELLLRLDDGSTRAITSGEVGAAGDTPST